MAGVASQAGDADSLRAPGFTSGFQGSVNVHRGALLMVPQWQRISSFVFYIIDMFNDTFRYFVDIFTIDNLNLRYRIPDIFPTELQLKKANTSKKETSFLD